jgi:hypothetical protein
VYEDLVAKGAIVPAQEVPPPTVPMDYSWARVSVMGIWRVKVDLGVSLVCLENILSTVLKLAMYKMQRLSASAAGVLLFPCLALSWYSYR